MQRYLCVWRIDCNAARLLVAMAAGFLAIGGCGWTATHIPTPPTARTYSSNLNSPQDVCFHFYKWDDGLRVMFVDGVAGNVIRNGTIGAFVSTETGSVVRPDGQGYTWRIATTDGKSAELTIGDSRYDLTKGKLFAMRLEGDKIVVHQLDVDLSALGLSIEQCAAFFDQHPEVVDLVTGKIANAAAAVPAATST
jgi:hypothetical protein